MFDCCGVRFVSPFSKKKPNFQNDQKSRENGTNMDIILSFLAKPVDKHGTTLVHITYPPLELLVLAEKFTVRMPMMGHELATLNYKPSACSDHVKHI